MWVPDEDVAEKSIIGTLGDITRTAGTHPRCISRDAALYAVKQAARDDVIYSQDSLLTAVGARSPLLQLPILAHTSVAFC